MANSLCGCLTSLCKNKSQTDHVKYGPLGDKARALPATHAFSHANILNHHPPVAATGVDDDAAENPMAHPGGGESLSDGKQQVP